MFFAVDPQSDVAIYQQIVNAVCADIRAGKLPYGAQLPTVRALADELGLARGTIKRAYDELGKLGMIEMTQGKGSFVCYRAERADSRKERAMQAIDNLISTLESLAFTPAEMSIFFDLKLRQLTSRDCDVRVAVAGGPEELLSAMADQLYELGGVIAYPYEDALPADGSVDLTVLRAGWHEHVPEETGGTLLRAAVSATPDTIVRLARLQQGSSVTAVAKSEEYLDLMRKSMRDFAPEVRLRCLRADELSTEALQGADTVLAPAGFERLFPPQAVEVLSAYSAAHPLCEYLQQIDGGSMLLVREAVSRLQAHRRRGLI